MGALPRREDAARLAAARRRARRAPHRRTRPVGLIAYRRPVESIFISSLARGEMGAIRQAARTAVESLGMRPVMFETTGASDQNSRRLLLDRIPKCDALLLLLGAEYGESGERGMSPTEEEFDEAQRAGVPVLALVQEGVDREPAQQAFVQRVRGTWEVGRFAPSFTDASDVMPAVVRTLNERRSAAPSAEHARAAEERALELARGPERQGEMQSGSKLRVVAVPLAARPLLDAVSLSDADALIDDVIGAARASRLVSNAMAVTGAVDRNDAIRLQAKS